MGCDKEPGGTVSSATKCPHAVLAKLAPPVGTLSFLRGRQRPFSCLKEARMRTERLDLAVPGLSWKTHG